METIVFAVIVVAWLAYLVPWFTSQHNDDSVDLAEPADGFADAAGSMTMVRRSADWDERDPELDVSTPFTRAAALHELRQTARLAAVRRRRLLVGVLVATAAVGAATPFTALPWWAAGVPAGLFLVSLVVCRFSVRSLDATLAVRREQIKAIWDNETIAIAIPAPEQRAGAAEATEYNVELAAPVEMTGSLWEPIPVIQPSYVTKPLVPRTVRTIDLSAPAAPIVTPPIAEAPEVEAEVLQGSVVEDADRPRAVGE